MQVCASASCFDCASSSQAIQIYGQVNSLSPQMCDHCLCTTYKHPQAQRKAEGEHTIVVAYSLEVKPEVLLVGRIDRHVKIRFLSIDVRQLFHWTSKTQQRCVCEHLEFLLSETPSSPFGNQEISGIEATQAICVVPPALCQFVQQRGDLLLQKRECIICVKHGGRR